MGRCYTLAVAGEDAMGLWWCHGIEGGMDQGIPEGMVPAVGGQRREREYVSGGGILLEVAEMLANDLPDVDAGGKAGKDKWNSIAAVEWKRGGEGGSTGDGSDLVDSPVRKDAEHQPSDTSSCLPLDHDPTMAHQTVVSTM
eukprot:g20486.t1